MANLAQMKTQQTAPAVAAANHPIIAKTQYIEKRKELLGAGIPGHMMVEREMRTATVMLMHSQELQQASPESFYGALSVAINSGIGLGNGKGYLVAYKGKVSFVPGWKGIVDLVSRSGRASVWTGVVHKGDHFRHGLGDSPFCEHVPGDNEDHKDITHYYAIGRVKGSEWPVVVVWSADKVLKHLNEYNKVGGRHYALKDNNNFEMYGRKVVLLQAVKYLPQSQDLENAINADIAHETGKELTIDGNFTYVPDDFGQHPADEDIKTDQRQNHQQQAQSAQAAAHTNQATRQQQTQQTAQRDPLDPDSDQGQQQTTQQSPVDKLKNRLRTLTDVDMLDAEASLIGDIGASPEDMDDMREIYHERRKALVDGPATGTAKPAQQTQQAQRRPAATRQAQSGMDLE